MSELACWHLPDQTRGCWVLRGPTGKLWAFPNLAGAWGKGVRALIDWEPTCPPVPPTVARLVANLLGVPGYGPLTTTEHGLALWEQVEEVREVRAT